MIENISSKASAISISLLRIGALMVFLPFSCYRFNGLEIKATLLIPLLRQLIATIRSGRGEM